MPLGLLTANSNTASARSGNCVVRNEGILPGGGRGGAATAPQWLGRALGPEGAAASFFAGSASIHLSYSLSYHEGKVVAYIHYSSYRNLNKKAVTKY